MSTELSTRNAAGTTALDISPSASQSPAAALSPRTYSEIYELSAAMHKSQMFGVTSPEQAMVVLMTGLELGFSPAQSFRSIHVINKKPTLSADMMVAVCKSRPHICKYFRLVDSTDERATYETHRVGEPEPVSITFTIQDAEKAGLLSNPTWQKFRPQMLRARAASSLVRVVYSDLILGLYTEDEIREIPADEPRRPQQDRPPDAERPAIAAPPVNEFPSQRKAQAAPSEKPGRSPESMELLKKVSSAIKATLDDAQIAELSRQHGALKSMDDDKLREVYAQIEAINAAKAAAVEPAKAEDDPFAPGAE